MSRMTIDERIARDGPRWRYIYLLEQERSQVVPLLRISIAMNVALAALTLWLLSH